MTTENLNGRDDRLDLAHAFELTQDAISADQSEQAFMRAGRFQLLRFELGGDSANAVFNIFPDEGDDQRYMDYAQSEVSWSLESLRVFINDMPETKPERVYLQQVERALTAYSWMQWSIEDTGRSMRPVGELAEVGYHARWMMEALEPLRATSTDDMHKALIAGPRPGSR